MNRVTVLVPTYNRETLLRKCLDSIRAQTFTDWRAVIGDNASTDRSIEVARSSADLRFELVCRPENIGYVRNTNLLLKDVDTEFVAILHSDDWWEPDFLLRLVGVLDQAPEASIAVSAVNYAVENGPVFVKRLTGDGMDAGRCVLSSADATRALVRTWPYLTPSDVLARTPLFRRFGFEESLPLSTDWLMWLRAASAGPVAVCNEPLANNRIHDASITGRAERDSLWADEWIDLTRIVGREWEAAAPYPDAATDLRTMNALRFVMKSYELHEQGNRAAAEKLARLARATAPSPFVRAGALVLEMFVRIVPASVAGWARRRLSRVLRRLRGSRVSGDRVKGSASTLTAVLAVLERSE